MTRWIKNSDKLATTKARQDILALAEAGLTAIDTFTIIRNSIKIIGQILFIRDHKFDLSKYKRVQVIGFGKVSCKAAQALEKILGSIINSGVTIGLIPVSCEFIRTYGGTHPEPSYGNVDISGQIFEISKNADEDDLVIVVVSGGGSALLCWPKNECDQGQILYHQFLKTGGTIEELNTIRKHLSLLKGGGLAKILYPARVIGLIFSDAPGEHYDIIASGPTYLDYSTIDDVKKIIKKYNLSNFDLLETPKEEKYFKRISNIPLVSNLEALESMSQLGENLGYRTKILTAEAYDETGEIIDKMRNELNNFDLVLAGGEPRMKVVEGGNGGRNLYASLVALTKLADNETFLSLASDGMDNSPVAGAIADQQSRDKALKSGLDIPAEIKKINSYNFFTQLDETLQTGDTEANASDLLILLKK